MIPSFEESHLEQICNTLGATDTGLTGSEIARYLCECNIPDPVPGMTKRVRLFEALRTKQRADRCSNNLCTFIERVMSPVIHVDSKEYFETKRAELNRVLAFAGLSLTEEGKLKETSRATTIPAAEAMASRLRLRLQERGVHGDVLKFCNSELLQANYFHAVLEASKSVAQKIRDLSGCATDGGELVDEAFGIGKKDYPLVAFNTLQTESEQSEHKGLMNLIKGFFGVFRNTTAHAPKITWRVTEPDALDMLTLASLLHRRLDSAFSTTPNKVVNPSGGSGEL